MIVYYIVDNNYRGKRLFRHNVEKKEVLQVVVSAGELKKGRPNMVGIYYVTESTLKTNYLWKFNSDEYNKDTHYTTEKLFDYWFDRVVYKLK